MQAAGMLRGSGAFAVVSAASFCLLSTLILGFAGENAHALPLQVLPNIPGYIPVYIRLGDQPLQDINPALAEAFREKAALEKSPPENLHNSENSDNHPSYDEVEEDDGLDAGSRKKETIYLIGVRQSGDKSKGDSPKIALPFEIVAREAEEGQDRGKSEDDWIEEPGKSRRPLAKQTIKAAGLPVDVKDLEKLAADVEKEETRPNDLYDSASSSSSSSNNDESAVESHIGKVSVWQRQPSGDYPSEKSRPETNTDDDLSEVDDAEEFGSRRSMSEGIARPSRDPKEFRPDESTDFMEGEE